MPRKKVNPKTVASLIKDTGILDELSPLLSALSMEVGKTDFAGIDPKSVIGPGFSGVAEELKPLLRELFGFPRSRDEIVKLLSENPLGKQVLALLSTANKKGGINKLVEAAYLSKQPEGEFDKTVRLDAPDPTTGEARSSTVSAPGPDETPPTLQPRKPLTQAQVEMQAILRQMAKDDPKFARNLAKSNPEMAKRLGLDPVLLSPAMAVKAAKSKLREGLSPVEMARMEKAGFGISEGAATVEEAIAPFARKLVELESSLPAKLQPIHKGFLGAVEKAIAKARATGNLAPLQKIFAGTRIWEGRIGKITKEEEAAQANEFAEKMRQEARKPKPLSSAEAYEKKILASVDDPSPRAVAERAALEKKILERTGKIQANKGILDKAMRILFGDMSWKSIKEAGKGFPGEGSLGKLGSKALRAAPAFFILQALTELLGAKRDQMESGWKMDLLNQVPTRSTAEALEDLQNERFLQGQGFSAVTMPNPKILEAVRQISQPRLSTGEFIAGQNPLIAGLREDPQGTEATLKDLMTSSLT